jgi:hypothetical protein
MPYPEAVAARAAQLAPARVALSVLAFPFWLLGLLVGIVWVVVAWTVAAVQVGVADARGLSRGVNDGAG